MAWSDEARQAALAARQGKGGSKDLGTVDSGGKWNMSQGADGNVTATHESGKTVQGSLGDVHEQIGRFGMEETMRRLGQLPASDSHAASTLGAGVPKGKGLTGIHSASAISRGMAKVRLAFRNGV